MTSPLPPRRRDTRSIADRVRQDRTNLSQLGVGFVGGRFPPLRPLGSAALLGDVEDDAADDGDQIVGEDGDRLHLTSLGTQVWQLLAEPLEETLVVRWHPDGGAGVEWKRVEHYDLSDTGGVVTIPAASLAAAGAAVGDVFSAQYLHTGEVASEFTIDWGSDGWSYLILPSTTSTTGTSGEQIGDTSDYSTTSALSWPVGQAPFGHGTSYSGGLPIATTKNTSLLWLRRTVPAAEQMTIRVRIEDNCIVYVNGTMVGFSPNHGSGIPGELDITVPDGVLNLDAPNVIAIRVCDEYPEVVNNLYVDVRIEATVSDA